MNRAEEQPMKTARVIVSMQDGDRDHQFVFDRRDRYIFGRAEDCDIHLPADEAHRDTSRHHCLLEVDPPTIAVRDLGSTNGTHVNGMAITFGARMPDDTDEGRYAATPLYDGDQVTVGSVVLRVEIEECNPPNHAEWDFAPTPSALLE
jgi:pSer/pThr/pTyr-binding forkhead associated (FHA) protein